MAMYCTGAYIIPGIQYTLFLLAHYSNLLSPSMSERTDGCGGGRKNTYSIHSLYVHACSIQKKFQIAVTFFDLVLLQPILHT